jgi:virginiamycin B lyase
MDARTFPCVGFLMLLAGLVVGCGGGGGVSTTPVTSTPTAGPTSASASVAPSSTSALTVPASNGVSGTFSLVTGATWPTGVSTTITSVTSGAPTPQSAQRKTLAATALATWKITFSGSTATANLSSAPTISFSGLTNPSSVTVELFDSTAGGSPSIFTYNATAGTFVATGTQFQVVLGDTFYLEIVSGSTLGASPSPSPSASPSASPSSTIAGTFTEYSTPANSFLQYITTGPDGALWFTENDGQALGRITTSGTITQVPLPPFSHTDPIAGLISEDSHPFGITTGPDGALWYADSSSADLGRVTTSGSVSQFGITTTTLTFPYDIVTGSDGALWFTVGGCGSCLNNSNFIGRMTTTGTLTTYNIPTAAGNALGITVGPDGALWFVEFNGDKIGRISTAGAITEYAVPTANSEPSDITTGPDGALWFDEFNSGKIGRITTAGTVTEYTTPTANSGPSGITTGPDGAVWFGEFNSGKIGRITTAGAFTEYTTPTANSQPDEITTGPDGALWFTEQNVNKIGRLH